MPVPSMSFVQAVMGQKVGRRSKKPKGQYLYLYSGKKEGVLFSAERCSPKVLIGRGFSANHPKTCGRSFFRHCGIPRALICKCGGGTDREVSSSPRLSDGLTPLLYTCRSEAPHRPPPQPTSLLSASAWGEGEKISTRGRVPHGI